MTDRLQSLRRADIAACCLFATLLVFASCRFETTFTQPVSPVAVVPDASLPIVPVDPGGPTHRLAYLVTSGGTSSKRTCSVEIRINAWPAGEARIFQAPVFYADNPVMPAPGYKAADVTVKDSAGNALAAKDTALGDAKLSGNFISVPAAARTLAYAVDLAPRDSARFGLPIPTTSPGVDLIDGAYYFILPLLGRDYATQWRSPAQLSLEFAEAPGRTLAGVDAKRTFATNYELMFVRGAFDPVRKQTISVRSHAVTIYATTADTFNIDVFGDLLTRCVGLVEDSLMVLPTKNYAVGENTQFWGIEGVQGYWFKPQAAAIPAVHVHELCHTFVGIFHSDLEDPWWKEGVTSYLGYLLSLQNGLMGDTAFASAVLSLRDTLPAVQHYALSSPYIRNHLFVTMDSNFVEPPDLENFPGLVYGKGSQAAMILDRYIQESTGGKKSIYDLIRDVVGSYGNAFRRSDLVASVNRVAGSDAGPFLEHLLDHAGPLGADSLGHTYAALRALGRFGPGGGKSKIHGIDPDSIPASAASVSDAPRSSISKSAGPGRAPGTVTPEIPRVLPFGSKL